MKTKILALGLAAATLVVAQQASAAITPYSWQRFDVFKQPGADSSGLNHPISQSFSGGSSESPGNSLQVVDNVCVGGPLGPEGYFSRYSLRCRAVASGNQGAFFQEPSPVGATVNTNAWGNFFQNNSNWVVESWVLPVRSGANDGNPGVIFATGLNRNNRSPGRQSGIALCAVNSDRTEPTPNRTLDGSVWLRCLALCPPGAVDPVEGLPMNFPIGPDVLIKTPTNAAWIHVAVVRDALAGTVSWYTNGVLVASTNSYRVFTTNLFSSPGFGGIQDSGVTYTNNNNIYGLPGGAQNFNGYMAELRWSSFADGQFNVTNLLTRPPGPSIVVQPKDITVWEGGAAPLVVVPATDTSLRFQWFRGVSPILDATNNTYVLAPTSVAADNGATFSVQITDTANRLITSSVATATVVANTTSLLTGYSNAVMSEASLKAYFPADGSSGVTLHNLKDPGNPGSFSNHVFFNANTNFAVGRQTVSINTPDIGYNGGYGLNSENTVGYVQFDGSNPDYYSSFTNGFGTIEAVLYMEPGSKYVQTVEQPCWFSSATLPGTTDFFQFRGDFNGNIFYQNRNQSAPLVWVVPGGLVGKRVHVAIVFDHLTNVTCYANGVSLGKKVQSAFGNSLPSATQPYRIGTRNDPVDFGNANATGYIPNLWRGSVDELAIYGTNLSANAIATHYFRLVNGTNNDPASIAAISPSKNLFTGYPLQTLFVNAGGLAPFTYQWRSNAVNIANATNSTYSVPSLPAGVYPYSVVIQGAVGGSITSAPVTITVINPTGYAANVYGSSGGGPRAFYPLSETSGKIIFDWSGTHDGEISGAYELGGQGPVAGTGSIKMFGTNTPTENSWVQVPYYPELNPISGNFTHEFWYKPASQRTICAVSSQFNIGNAKAGLATMLGYGTVGINQTTVQYWTMIYGKYNNVNQGVAQNGAGTQGTVPQAGDWNHIASVCDADNSVVAIYVNGNAEYVQNVGYSVHPGDGSTTGGVNQNNAAPLILGNRNLGLFPMDGSLSQVAIYDYALTDTDVANHTSQVYVPAVITRQPVGVTNSESFTTQIQLTGNASGAPNSYQWQKDGADIIATTLSDGTQKYPLIGAGPIEIQGPNSRVLVIREVNPGDSGQYRLRVNNPLNTPDGFINSSNATVLINANTNQPAATNAYALGTVVSGPIQDHLTGMFGTPSTPAGPSLVRVVFNKRMLPSSATNPANYTVSGTTVTEVYMANNPNDTRFGGDQRIVTLRTSGLTPGANYTLDVTGVQDQNFTPLTIPAKSFHFTAPVLTPNVALWDYYFVQTANYDSRASGTNSGFPFVPQVSRSLTNFDLATINGDSVAGADLNNVAAFNSGFGNNFFHSITAWLTPTASGTYDFFMEADDSSGVVPIPNLYINPAGPDPAGAAYYGSADSGSYLFKEFALASLSLTSGTAYFVQVQGLDSGGGDRLKLSWRLQGDPTPADQLKPIPGQFLSAYAQGALPSFGPSAFSGGNLTLSWTGSGVLLQSTNAALPISQWTVVPGNPNSPYVVAPGAAPQMYYRLSQPQTP